MSCLVMDFTATFVAACKSDRIIHLISLVDEYQLDDITFA